MCHPCLPYLPPVFVVSWRWEVIVTWIWLLWPQANVMVHGIQVFTPMQLPSCSGCSAARRPHPVPPEIISQRNSAQLSKGHGKFISGMVLEECSRSFAMDRCPLWKINQRSQFLLHKATSVGRCLMPDYLSKAASHSRRSGPRTDQAREFRG